ncbi:MAG: DNA polymerase III subunit delta, partial [Terriglobia bacterium]
MEFCSLIENGKPGPAYFLCGPDRYLHEECRAAVLSALPAGAGEWCFMEAEPKPGELCRELENACQMPMLGGHSFLYLTDAEDFGRANEEDAASLERFLHDPPGFATVLFAAAHPDRRRRFIKLLEKRTKVVDLLPLGRREAAAWLNDFLHKRGFEVEPPIAETLVALFEGRGELSSRETAAGVNLLWLRTETEKLMLVHPEDPRIRAADLDLIAPFREEHEIGRLLAAVADRRLSDALPLLRNLVAGKEPETLILWCIGDLFRQALKGIGQPTRSFGGWSRAANPFSTFEIAPRALRSYSREELAGALRLVRAADLAVKSSWKDSSMLLECLLWQITAGQGAHASPEWL